MFIFREPWKNYIKLLCFSVAIYTVAIIFNKLSIQNGWWFRLSDNLFTDFLPIFISVVMLDITYKLGKQQENIQKRQTEIAEQQRRLQEYQYKLDKYQHYEGLYKNLKELQRRLTEFRIFVNSSMCHPYFYSGRDVLEYAINEMRKLRKNVEDNQAAFALKLPNEVFGYDDIIDVFIHCEWIVDRVSGYKLSMQNIDNYSIEQIKRRYGDILEGIAKNNPKVNLDKIYNLQDNRAAFIEGIKVIIQDKLAEINKKYPPHCDSVDMLAEIADVWGFDKNDIINWYSEIDQLMDKIYVQSDILNRIQKECAIDINN